MLPLAGRKRHRSAIRGDGDGGDHGPVWVDLNLQKA
jgi:hypothetical protein